MAGEISGREFARGGLTSESGLLLGVLAQQLLMNYGEIPAPHMKLIENLGKSSSITGFIQVTGPAGLQLLQVIFST